MHQPLCAGSLVALLAEVNLLSKALLIFRDDIQAEVNVSAWVIFVGHAAKVFFVLSY